MCVNSDNYKAEQKAVVDRTAIMQLLDTMHFYMGDVDISGREAVAASVEDEESVAYAVENWKKIAEEEAQADPVERADMVEQRIKEDLAELESTLGKKVGKKVYLTKNDKLKLISAEKGMRENVFDPVKHAETCISTLSGDLQLRAHHAWDRITPVRPQEINIDLFFDDEEARERAEDLEGTYILYIITALLLLIFVDSSVL